jgi:hypothetical protein
MATNVNRDPVKQDFAAGATFAVAILLFTGSLLGVLQGIAAVAEDDIFVVGPEYSYKFSTATWGWIHIVVGILGIAVAFGLFTSATWARTTAVVVAAVSIVANFLWLPHYPLWSILLIALDLIVIWAVTTWKGDVLHN